MALTQVYASTGTNDSIQSGTNDFVQWFGRNVNFVTTQLASFAAKIKDYVGPALKKIAEFFTETFATTADYISNHKDIVYPVIGAGTLMTFISIAAYKFFCENNAESKEKANPETTAKNPASES